MSLLLHLFAFVYSRDLISETSGLLDRTSNLLAFRFGYFCENAIIDKLILNDIIL